MQSYPLLNLNKTCSGAIAAHRIVKATGTDGTVAQAASSTDSFLGVSGQEEGLDKGRIDIDHAGIATVEYGGNVVQGDRLTSDANDKAIVAQTGQATVGIAQENGDAGTLGSVLIEPTGAFSLPDSTAAAGFVANDLVVTAAEAIHDAVIPIPATAAASTVTLPAGAPDGTRLTFVADGAQGHTVQYRDATGPANLTTALTASKKHMVVCVKEGAAWYANAYVSP